MYVMILLQIDFLENLMDYRLGKPKFQLKVTGEKKRLVFKKKTDESFVRNIEGTENAQPFSGNIGCYSRSLCMEN